MSKSISQLTSVTTAGADLLELSRPSATVTITAATISALASDNSFNDSGNGFVTAGFVVGMRVRVQGFTGNAANNIFSAHITALTTGKMTIGGADGDVIVDDAAGESVTITAWESKRTTAREVAASRFAVLTLTDGATINVDASANDNFRVVLGGNRTLANPTGMVSGQVLNFRVHQDATGNRTLAYGNKYKFAGGAPTLSTAASAKDFISCQYDAADDTLYCAISKAMA